MNKGSKTSYLPHDKKGTSAKGKRILKRASPDSTSQQSLRSLLPFSESSATQTHGVDWPNPSSSSTLGLGNLVQGQSGSHPRRADRANQSSINDLNGDFRGGTSCSLEEPVPAKPNQWAKWKSGVGSSSVGIDTKPMVEVHHGFTFDIEERSQRTEQAEKAISSAILGRFSLAGTGKEGDRLQGVNLNTSGEHPYIETIPNG